MARLRRRARPTKAGYDPTASNSIADSDLPPRTYLDLSARQKVIGEGRRGLEMFGIAPNLANSQPPARANLVNSGGNPYDVVGRTYRFGIRASY